MVTIVVVWYSFIVAKKVFHCFQRAFHNGSFVYQTNTTAGNMEIPAMDFDLPSDIWNEEADFEFDVESTMLLDGQTPEDFFFEFQGPGQSKQESGNTNNSGNHGVINYNFYNQQWQNSVDLEHAMENNATAYGGAGGGDSTHTTNRTENLLLSGLQAVSNILPLLADGLTEDFENSDRVGKTQAGATTLVTQHQVGCMTYPGRKSGPSPSSAADEPTTAGPSVDRFITLPVGNWTQTQAVYSGWALPLPWVPLTRNTPFGALGRRHFLLNCGWHIQVQVNSTRFHGGALGVFMVPQFVYTSQTDLTGPKPLMATDYPLFNQQQLFLFPHQILNPRTNSSVDIQVPYANCTPGCDPTQQAPWTLLIVVLSPLSYASGATTSLEVVASIRPLQAQFHGIRQTNSEFEGLPKNRNESSAFAFCSTQPHSAEPDYGAMHRSSPSFLPAEITDFLQISQIPTLTSIRAVSFQQAVPKQALLTMNVSLTANDLLNTSLETVSRGFAQYRGSILIRMLYTGNQMQNVRYVAAYTPPGALPPADRRQTMVGIYTIYDTGLNSGSDFVIPFISTTDYRYCNAVDGLEVGSGGYFTIWQLTTLAVPPGSPTTAELLIFAASGKDFEWRCVASPYLALQGEDTQITPAETGQTPEVTAENSNQNVVPIPYAPQRISHSAVRFWYDRFFLADSLQVNYKSSGSYLHVLRWPDIFEKIPEVRWFMHATYCRFELEIAIRPWNQDVVDYEMVYWPPGSLLPTDTVTWVSTADRRMRQSGPQPRWTWNTGTTPCFTARIPFTAPSSVLTQTYTGWSNTSHAEGTFGNTPGLNVLGALTLTQGSKNGSGTVITYISYRLVDIQMWCPRPGLYVAPPIQQSSGATNFSLLRLAGDVELNPGPPILSVARKLDPDLDQMFKKFEIMQESFKKLTDCAQWINVFSDIDKRKWFKRIMKFLSYAVILSRARHDPLLAAATAFLLSGDWLSRLCAKIVKWLPSHCRTQPPPFPSSDENPDDGSKDIKKESASSGFSLLVVFKNSSKPLSVNSGDIKPKTDDVPLIDLTNMGPKIDYPGSHNPFGESLADKLVQENERLVAEAQAEYARRSANPFEDTDVEPEKLFDKFKRFFSKTPKMEGPIMSEINQVLVLCRNAQWLAQQLQKILGWLGVWKQQEEDASEERFRERMQVYPQMMEQYEQYKNSPRHQKWNDCKTWFDEMRKLAVLHDPKLVNLFPNMASIPHENSRQEPILIVLRGKPGQGKSVAASMLAQMFAHSLSGKPDYYSYNSSTNYFDGYQQQPVVLIDDLGQDPAGTDFSVFCQMISTTPFLPNMASLNDKGIKFKSDVIIATTNLPEFKPVTIADPGALQRRINFDFEVEAGQSYKTKAGTLDLAKALEPTGCSAPLHMVKADIHLFSSACLKFKDRMARCECSLVGVYDRVMNSHKRRNDLANKLVEIFNFQGPKEHDPRQYNDKFPVPVPRRKDVEKWCDLAIAQDPHDDEVLSFLRRHCDHALFGAYLRRFYGAGPDPLKPPNKYSLRKALDMISIVTQVLALILMLMSLGIVIWQLFNMEGAYSGNAVVRDKKKPNGLKVIDIASLQGPMNFDLEKSLLARNIVTLHCRRKDGSEFETGALAVRGRLVVMNFHLWNDATHLQLDGEWMPRDTIPAVRPAANGIPTELVFMNWAKTPGRQFRDITTYFPRSGEGHFKLSPAAKVTGICGHMQPSFMFQAESLGTAESAKTWESVVPMVLKYKAQTAPGFCGSVVVVDNGIWKKVFGLHCAGAHGVGMAAIISREMVDAISQLAEFQGRIHSAKNHQYVYTPHKTQLYPTVACDDNTTVEPAALSPNDKRLVKPEEFKKTILAKHVGDRTDGPLAMIRGARFYARLVRAKCGQVNERLSLHEAVFGTDNLDPMDQTRSPGWPYIGTKRRPDLLWQTDEGLDMDPVLRAELMLMMEGNFSHHKFVTFLKDELRDKEKVKQGKTRVIDIASYGHAIMGRVLFGRLAAAMHAHNGVDLGSAVGTNPDIDWTRYAAEFKFKNFVDVDYSGFDATHSTFSFQCLKIFLQELGFDDVALKYVDSLCDSTHIWDDEIFKISGGLPSGCSCTSIFNTILNNIVVRSLVPEVYDGEFQILAYGDDLVLCSQEIFPVEKYKEIVEEMTNYRITPASKSGTFEWTDLSGVVFLKRYFYKDGLLVRPVMTYKNLHNILSWARAGTVQEKLLSVARLAQHRGEQDYKALMEPFESCGYFVPSFDDLELEFFSLFFG
ncbi:polyprotein [hunnivirus A1]|uniref:Genome polyprotein n=11 Tax=hunnivirus A1 TaxID=1233320 RepID=J9Y0I9_9PICO|nr:polyprotein [hunnivirus A1]AFS33288.1 polyprotein [hunnivirus A1]